ncbi:LysR family transcriptional regulator [Paractinoplanes lichenicola]|uniref:LysR family transcriptional regulator n=1 Tax=Paractinoplanes lichenicola TaxID=2802976 RepID=A0ABS1VFH5_9ACTN|nr:LysR family transcriptional regulator [Actinoplanes lichenicola]MBL7253370.1 LysR family transcriptional regulator [Actinoplanes lichenicola]
MGPVLDILALRSLIAVADCGGFHRAAAALKVSQSAVSQHVRRLEKVIGRPVVERQGRATVFTPDGQALLGEARRILAAHDDALRRLLVGPERPAVTVGTTEHAADLLLPAITAALPGHQVRFRIDRTRRLDAAVDRGAIDVAVHLAEASAADGVPVGSLPLTWYAATGWAAPPGPWPVVAIEEPCVLRRRALTALTARGLEPYVVCDSGYVAGVLEAVRSGLGVALMATAATTPDGLRVRDDLPAVQPAAMSLRARSGADPQVVTAVTDALHTVLAQGRR